MGLESISALSESIESILDDKTKAWHPYLCTLEQKCGVSKVNTFFLLCFLVVLYLMFGVGAPLLCNLVGFIVPARKTLRALQLPNFEETTKWLSYWLIFASLALLDHVSDWLIEQVCPLYWPLKCLLLLWCMSDLANNGSYVIYTCFLKPLSTVVCGSSERFALDPHNSCSDDSEDVTCITSHCKSP